MRTEAEKRDFGEGMKTELLQNIICQSRGIYP